MATLASGVQERNWGRKQVRAGREAEQGKLGSRAPFQLEIYKHHHTLVPIEHHKLLYLGQNMGGDGFRSNEVSQEISGSQVQAEKKPYSFRKSTMFNIVLATL